MNQRKLHTGSNPVLTTNKTVYLSMEETAQVISKRVKKGFFRKTYFLGVVFDNLQRKGGGNTIEIEVSFMAYSDIKVGDNVLCPMKVNEFGITFDYDRPLMLS